MILILIHLMNLIKRYRCSKECREHKVEEPPLGSLAVTGNLEEGASHRVSLLMASALDVKEPRLEPTGWSWMCSHMTLHDFA